MSGPHAVPGHTLTISAIKEEIERRALERQAQIARGEIAVPVHYYPVPVAPLMDLTDQLEYRHDFLDLAGLPAGASLLARFKAFCKRVMRAGFRWLLIRQVEFNAVVLEHACESARLVELLDRNLGEVYAAVGALKLQANAFAQRLAWLETGPAPVEGQRPAAEPEMLPREGWQDKGPAYQVYLSHFLDQGTVLDLACGRGDFVKLLVSEGVAVQGVEADRNLAEACREQELPVLCEDGLHHLGQRDDESLGGIYLGHVLERLPPPEAAQFLGRCWAKLRKGGVLIAEAWNPACPVRDAHLARDPARRHRVPVELLSFLVESQCFTLVECVFSGPVQRGAAAVARTDTGRLFDLKQYRDYAVIGRK